jgi:hypothetical protein
LRLRRAGLIAVKELFTRLGVTFTREALEKAAPFGIGVVISFRATRDPAERVGRRL